MAIGNSRVEEIFSRAYEIESSADRVAYLNQSCGDDAIVRERVERLLDAAPNLGSFLEGNTDKIAVTLDYQIPDYVGSQIGPYKIREQLGEGGMGIVYVAEQVEPVRRKVALKIIKPGMDSRESVARFEAERQALAMMDHPNIAYMLDAGTTENGRPYFVMELIRGIPIYQTSIHR